MTKAELEGKHLAELHALAAAAAMPSYRMLTRAELIERLAGEEAAAEPRRAPEPSRRRRERRPREPRREREAPRPEPATPAPEAEAGRPRRRRRRRFRRRKSIRAHELLLPAAPGRQTIVYAESREACTALLRSLAAELAKASKGPEPVAVLVDPGPEELAEWRREAPAAEIVAAGKAQHVEDALGQAARRAEQGESVIVLIDSLSRFAEEYGDADGARDLFESGLAVGQAGGGSLTVVAGLQRS